MKKGSRDHFKARIEVAMTADRLVMVLDSLEVASLCSQLVIPKHCSQQGLSSNGTVER